VQTCLPAEGFCETDETFPQGKFMEKQMSDESRTTSKKRRENVPLLLGFALFTYRVNLSKNVITNQGHVCLIYVTPSSQETHCDVTVNKELIKKNKKTSFCVHLLKDTFDKQNNKAQYESEGENSKRSGHVFKLKWNCFISCNLLRFRDRVAIIGNGGSFFGVLDQSRLLHQQETIVETQNRKLKM
jgi:hypothetical protein